MENPIIIAPFIRLPSMKEVHAIGKKQEESVSRNEAADQSGAKDNSKQCYDNAKAKHLQRKPAKGKNSTGK